MNRKSVLVAVLIGALLLTACRPAATPTPVPTIKIGIMGPYTGAAASIGLEQLNFARLAVADFNKRTGLNAILVEKDTELDPDKAKSVAEEFAADADVYGVVGPTGSQEVEASASVFEDAGLAHVSSSATRTTLTASGHKTFYRVVPNDSKQAPTDAHFIGDILGAKTVFAIDDQSSYSQALADEVAQLLNDKGVAVTRESVAQDVTDFTAIVAKMQTAQAQAVFFPGQVASQGAQLWYQLKAAGVAVTVVGGDGFNSPDFYGGGANEGSYISMFGPIIDTLPDAATVVKDYTAQYGRFTSFGAPTYVAAQVLLEAAERALKAGALSRAGVLAEVAKTNLPTSILGTPVQFDANGDVGTGFYLYIVKDGRFVTYNP